MTYLVEWGDDTVDEGFVESGGAFNLSHIWDKKGDYLIKAKLIDDYGADSNWAKLTVTMPRNRAYSNTLLLRLLEQFPILNRLLSLIK